MTHILGALLKARNENVSPISETIRSSLKQCIV
jgi:hypothetical protein